MSEREIEGDRRERWQAIQEHMPELAEAMIEARRIGLTFIGESVRVWIDDDNSRELPERPSKRSK